MGQRSNPCQDGTLACPFMNEDGYVNCEENCGGGVFGDPPDELIFEVMEDDDETE